jgi:hypothetical protein
VTVRVDGRLVLVDAVVLSADEGHLAARMGRFDVLCAATIVGQSLRPPIDEVLNWASDIPFERNPDLLVAAAPLSGAGCILRIAGRSVQAVGRVLARQLSFVSDLLGDDPWSRKW